MKLNTIANAFLGKKVVKSIYKGSQLVWSKDLKPPTNFKASVYFSQSGSTMIFSWDTTSGILYYNLYSYPTGSQEEPSLVMEIDKDNTGYISGVAKDPTWGDEMTFFMTSVIEEGESYRSNSAGVKFSMGDFEPEIYYDEPAWRIVIEWKEDLGINSVETRLISEDGTLVSDKKYTGGNKLTYSYVPPVGFGNIIKVKARAFGHDASDVSPDVYELVDISDTQVPTTDYTVTVGLSNYEEVFAVWSLAKYTKTQIIKLYADGIYKETLVPGSRETSIKVDITNYLGKTIHVIHYASNDMGISAGVTSNSYQIDNSLSPPYISEPTILCCNNDNGTGGNSWEKSDGAISWKVYIGYSLSGDIPDPVVFNVDTADPSVAVANGITVIEKNTFFYAYIDECRFSLTSGEDHRAGTRADQSYAKAYIVTIAKAFNGSVESENSESSVELTYEEDYDGNPYCSNKPT